MSIDVDQKEHGPNCEMPTTGSHDSVDMEMKVNCPMQHGDHCKDHPGCVGKVSISSIQIPSLPLFSAIPPVQQKFIIESESVSTVYPSHLKRPPKA